MLLKVFILSATLLVIIMTKEIKSEKIYENNFENSLERDENDDDDCIVNDDCNEIGLKDMFQMWKKDDRSQKLKDFIKKSFHKNKNQIKLTKLKDLLTMRY
jgi:hypothetical protein